MDEQHDIKRLFVVKVAIASEAFLLVLALVWARLREIPIAPVVSGEMIAIGLLATIPLLAFNFIIFAGLAASDEPDNIYRRFKVEIIRPLCANLDVPSAMIVGITSGIGEEFFFRAVLNHELAGWFTPVIGLTLGSFVFAYVHFIGMAHEFRKILMYYFAFGLYFSILVYHFQNVTPAVIAHALYNFFAILYVRYYDIPRAR